MREKTEGIYQYKHQCECSCKPAGKNPAITNISSAKQGEQAGAEVNKSRAQASTSERREDGREAEKARSRGRGRGPRRKSEDSSVGEANRRGALQRREVVNTSNC